MVRTLRRHAPARAAFVFFSLGAAQTTAAADAYLLGDWQGARSRLAERGIVFDLAYGGELAHNASGGDKRITRYADQYKFGARLDLDRLWGWHGASFQLLITDRNGRNLGADARIGNNQLFQEIYGRGQTWHITILAYEQQFFGGRLGWRIGRLPVVADLAAFTCDFQNLSFCGSLPGNLIRTYWVNAPTSQWASRWRWNFDERHALQLAAYQVNPIYIDDGYARRRGLDLDFPAGTLGWLFPLEYDWKPVLAGLPGMHKFGVWYTTAAGDDVYLDIDHRPRALTGAEPLRRQSRYGAYVELQQQVSGEPGGRGASVFFNAVQTERRTAPTDRQFGLGMEYRGVFGRAGDFVGMAVGATHANSRAAAYQRQFNRLHPRQRQPVLGGYEYVTELFYNYAPLPSVQLRPNLQYVLHPGGSTENPRALVLGLKTLVTF